MLLMKMIVVDASGRIKGSQSSARWRQFISCQGNMCVNVFMCVRAYVW